MADTGSPDIFGYLNDCWELLPEEDKLRFGETWRAYEQTYGSEWLKLFERSLSVNIDTLPLYNNQRWLKHTFDLTTQVNRAARYRTTQDLGKGVNLTLRYLIKFSVDAGTPIEINLQGTIPDNTTGEEIVAAINAAAGFNFTQLVVQGALIDFVTATTGPSSRITFYPASISGADASALILGLDPLDLPLSFPQFPYEYQLGDQFIASIPQLQLRIHDDQPDQVLLREGMDYSIEFGTGIISFVSPPPVKLTTSLSTILATGSIVASVASTADLSRGMSVSGIGIASNTYIVNVASPTQVILSAAAVSPGGVQTLTFVETEKFWGKDNLVNRETPYNNYGYLMGIYDSNTPAYLKSIKGLWFAFWTGPRPENIRRSLYLLFGLPTASQDGVVTGVTLTTITLTYTDQSTEVFTIPTDLLPSVVLGQGVTKFQPLVTGITVLDKINSPGFLNREIGRFGIQSFLTENATLGIDPNTDESRALKTVEQNTYLPQIDVNAFISPNIKLSNVRTFLQNIQPKSRTFLFQVLVGTFRDALGVDEFLGLDMSFEVAPNMDWNPSLDMDVSELELYLTLDTEGMMFNELIDIDVYHDISTIPAFVENITSNG